MHVAEALDLFHRHAFLDELLLHCRQFGSADAVHQLLELRFDLLDAAALMKPADQFLQNALALFAVVDKFAHCTHSLLHVACAGNNFPPLV